MGGRGTFAAGNFVDFTYETVGYVNGVKVLKGKDGTGKPVFLNRHIRALLISSLSRTEHFTKCVFMTRIIFCTSKLVIIPRSR